MNASNRLTVNLTEDYRLQSDGTQYILQTLVTVDPTLSIGWGAKVADALAKGLAEPYATKRTEWRNCTAPYYGLNDAGLISAINSVKYRMADDMLGDVTLTEFVAFIRKQSAEMIAKVSGE